MAYGPRGNAHEPTWKCTRDCKLIERSAFGRVGKARIAFLSNVRERPRKARVLPGRSALRLTTSRVAKWRVTTSQARSVVRGRCVRLDSKYRLSPGRVRSTQTG